MIIREIRESDNQILANIIRATFEEHNAPKEGIVYSDPTTDNLFDLFKEQKSILWVAETDNNKIVGCCGVYPTPGLPYKCAELVKFYIDKEARGYGLGRVLMEESTESAKTFGYKQLYLESLPHYSRAVKMYKAYGFKSLDKPLGNSGHPTCNIWMLKDLI